MCHRATGFITITAHFAAFVTEMCGAIPSGALASLGITSTSALGALSI